MAVLHIGTMTTLAAVPKADISNNDVAYVWNSSWSRKMVYDSTSTEATDIINHPYYQRPTDYASAGVWIEAVGADENQVFNASQIITGQLRSTNCTTATGSEYDLDNATIKLGGTQVDATGSYRGIFAGLDSGLYKLYAGDGANKYFKFDGTNISWRGANASLSTSGVFTATNAVLTGSVTASIGAIGGFTLATTTLTATNLLLDAGNQEIKLGTGDDIISLDAADATYRLAIGHATYASAPFRVSKAGVLYATGASISGNIYASTGTIGGWAIGSNYLTSTSIGLHSASAASGAQILIGHATSYASAEIGLKADGSGKLASGNISWDTVGAMTLAGPYSSSATITGGVFTVDTTGFLHSASKATYGDPDAGFFLGYDSAYKLNIGDASSYLKWSGTALELKMASGETFDLYGSLDIQSGGDLSVKQGGDIILEGGSSGNPSILDVRGGGTIWNAAVAQINFSSSDDVDDYFSMFLGKFTSGTTHYALKIGPNSGLVAAGTTQLYLGGGYDGGGATYAYQTLIQASNKIHFQTNSTNIAIDTSGDMTFDASDLIVWGTGTFSGVVTTGGADPPYEVFWAETRESVVERIKQGVPSQYMTGCAIFYNSVADQMELFLPTKGEFRDLGNSVIETIDPINPAFETKDHYYVNPITGEMDRREVPITKFAFVVKDDCSIDHETGKFFNNMKKEIPYDKAVVVKNKTNTPLPTWAANKVTQKGLKVEVSSKSKKEKD